MKLRVSIVICSLAIVYLYIQCLTMHIIWMLIFKIFHSAVILGLLVYNSMNFNTRIDSCNYYLNQDTDKFYQPDTLPLASINKLLLNFLAQLPTESVIPHDVSINLFQFNNEHIFLSDYIVVINEKPVTK